MFQTCNDLTSLRNSLADQIYSNAKWPEVKEILDEALERAAYIGISEFVDGMRKVQNVVSSKEIETMITEFNELEFPPI